MLTWLTSRSLAYIHSNGICHRDIKPQVTWSLHWRKKFMTCSPPESSAWSWVWNPQALRFWQCQASGQGGTQCFVHLLSILQVFIQLESLPYIQLLFKFLQGTWADFWSDRLHNEHWCVECWLRFCWADVGPGWCEWMRSKSMDVGNLITTFASKLFSLNCFPADFPWW